MSWSIEGKISEWTLTTNGSKIKFTIKAKNDVQIKRKDKDYNVFVDTAIPPNKALPIVQDKKFKAHKKYLSIFTSCKDNLLVFKFNYKKKAVGKLLSITVK